MEAIAIRIINTINLKKDEIRFLRQSIFLRILIALYSPSNMQQVFLLLHRHD